MPPVPSSKAPVLLVCGDDDFGVKERARQVFRQLLRPAGIHQNGSVTRDLGDRAPVVGDGRDPAGK